MVSDEMLGVLLDSEPYLSLHKRLIQASLVSVNEYERELVVARNQLAVLMKRTAAPLAALPNRGTC